MVVQRFAGTYKPRQQEKHAVRSAADSPSILLEHLDGPGDLKAARCVLRHAYTQTLPNSATLSLLMQMAIQADKWDMPDTLKACLLQAASLKDVPVEDINLLLQADWPATITTDGTFQAVSVTALLRLFGRAQAVVAKPELLEAFCSLSLPALQLWAQQDKLVVDSENTVAVLFTHWWERNIHGLDSEQAAEASSILTQSIRVGHLTNTFLLGVLDELPWFDPTDEAWTAIKILNDTFSDYVHLVKDSLPEGWSKPARTKDEQQEMAVGWTVSKAQMDNLHKDAGKQGAAWLVSESFYWFGYRWKAALCLPDQKSQLGLGVKCISAMPGTLPDTGLPFIVLFSFDVAAKRFVEGDAMTCQSIVYGPRDKKGCASYSLLGVQASTEPRSNSYPSDEYWNSDKLYLQVKITKVG